MRRSGGNSILGSPVLVGAITVLVVIVAIFLSYNANAGLPFVPTREMKVTVRNAEELQRGNEVREGGYRVGIVSDIGPARLPGGGSGAELDLKLDKSVGRIPSDTRWVIRPRSLLGLKYVDLQRGARADGVPDGHVFPIAQASASVDIDRLYAIFDARTRAGGRMALTGLGDSLAGRAQDLNDAIGGLPPLLGHLERVARVVADPRTGLARFIGALDTTFATLAPVARTGAHLCTTMADTFGAIAHDPVALRQTIERTPPTLLVSTRALAVERPFLDHTAAFSRDLNAVARDLRPTLPPLNAALEAGPPVLRRSSRLDAELQRTFDTLYALATDPATDIALRALGVTVRAVRTELRFLGPYQTVCDYWDYFWTDIADHFSQKELGGFGQRALLNSAAQQDNSPANMGANVPANGEGYVEATRSRGDPYYLHGQPYGAAIDARGRADCEAGQRGWANRLATTAPKRFHIAVNPQTPGDQGTTYKGRRRVPRGETYDAQPRNNPELRQVEAP